MYCKNCGVKINCAADKCPLCHAPLEKKDENAVRAFPEAKIKMLRTDKVNLFYGLFALIATAACLADNLLTNSQSLWSGILTLCLIYLCYTVRFTVIAQQSFHGKLFGQTVALTLLFIAIQLIVGNWFIFIEWLPIVYFLSELLLIIYIFTNKKEARKRFMSLVVMGILGVISASAAYIFDISVKLPGIIVSALSGAVVIVTLLAGRKYVIGELKRYFHR